MSTKKAKSGIHIKPSKVGSLHKHLGIPEGEKIPASKLKIKSTDSPAIRKKKTFAINAKGWHHAFLGESVDPVPTSTIDYNATAEQINIPKHSVGNYGTAPYHPQVANGALGRQMDSDMEKLTKSNVAPERNAGGINLATLVGGISAINSVIPHEKLRNNVLGPEYSPIYNPHPQGTGSQALMKQGGYVDSTDESVGMQAKNGHWIQHAVNPAHRGFCSPMSKPTCTGKRRAFAETMKKHHGFHENGGIIPEAGNPFYTGKGDYKPAKYAVGGTLSPDKAREMLADGTAHGKALSKKQKQYFGMVASGKADMGMTVGDPEPKKSKIQTLGTQQKIGEKELPHFGYYATDPSTQLAHYADRLNELVAKGYDPLKTEQGRAWRSFSTSNNPDITNGLIGNIRAFQSDPTYNNMTPEQRLNKFYNQTTGNAPVDEYFKSAKLLGGAPSAFYQNSPISRMANGGVMYAEGGPITTHWGGNAELESYNPYDGGTIQFNGASHDNGGIGMSYNGHPVEVEGGETATKDPDGTLNIMGNLYIPGTRTKFKAASKEIAAKEKKYTAIKEKGSDMVNERDPLNRYDLLRFNTGKLMMQGGDMAQEHIAEKKQQLATLQRALLDTAEQHNVDAEELSKGNIKKAKTGTYIKAEDGAYTDPEPKKLSIAQRHNNPGNIKYGDFAKRFGAVPGENSTDGGKFAKFPDINNGMNALQSLLKSKNYVNLDVDSAIKRWTNGSGYNNDLGAMAHKKIKDLNEDEFKNLVNTITYGEDSKYYPSNSSDGVTPLGSTAPVTPINSVRLPSSPDYTFTHDNHAPITYHGMPIVNNDLGHLNPSTRRLPSNAEQLNPLQLLPDLYALGANHEIPVQAQRFQPNLYSPYQVSFQDRRNENSSTFRSLEKMLGATNPAALGTLAAQKYNADNQVSADEFRTNQGILSDVINKNVGLSNDAQLKNLAIADQQYARQTEAKANTRALNQMILNDVAAKYLQNNLENKNLAIAENLYDYRFVPNQQGGMQATYMGPNAQFDFSGTSGQGNTNPFLRQRVEEKIGGKKVTTTSPSQAQNEKLQLDIQRERNKKFNLNRLFNH